MRVVVTGAGVVSSLGIGREKNLRALLSGQSGISAPVILPTVHTHLPVGEVKYTDRQLCERIGILDGTVLPRTALLGILAAREALAQAGRSPDTNMAFISGTTVGGMDLTERYWNEYQQGNHTETVALHEAGESTVAIARYLSSNQPSQFAFMATPSTACSSALNAIMTAADMIRTGLVQSALAGGSESLSLFHFNGFRSLMILDTEICRPFDSTRAGLNLGEGAGYLVLETEESALQRGAAIIAYIGGYANACDAFHQTASSENGEGAYIAMQQAIGMAGLQPEDISFVKAHGTATPNNDASESAALRRVFGDRMPPVCSTKAFTGHTTSACGGLEAVFCLMAMRRGFVPASLNWKESDNLTIQPNPHTLKKEIHHVLCNAFGFGGNESSLIFSSAPVNLPDATATGKAMQLVASVDQNATDDLSNYITALEARRMTPQTRKIVMAAHKALREAGIDVPDAIVCATRWGCMRQSMQFLTGMLQSQEQDVKPTFFMQSTHNTIASTIAIRLGCHGYNNTYSQGERSLECALADVRAQMTMGRIRNALVLEFDEQTEQWDYVLEHIGERTCDIARAYVYRLNNK